MIRIAAALFCAVFTSAASAQEGYSYSDDLGLPYWAPGRGLVDHDALRRRSLDVLERQYAAFSDATDALAQAAIAHCDQGVPEADLKQAFADTWRAWAPLDSYQFGPVEQSGAVLSINFWPDKKNFVGRALRDLLAKPEAEQRSAEAVAAGSAGAQGLPALERLIYTDIPTCPAVIGVSAMLNQTAEQLYLDWFGVDGWADLARAAGPNNPVYLSADEFTKTLYTALDFGLIRISEQRLGRPLGTYERSFPKRAEAWRAGLTRDIIAAQLDGTAEMIRFGFAGDLRDPDRAWVLGVIEQAHRRLNDVDMPIAEAVVDPRDRFKVELLQQKIDALRLSLAEDIGPGLGVDTGFSPADGD